MISQAKPIAELVGGGTYDFGVKTVLTSRNPYYLKRNLGGGVNGETVAQCNWIGYGPVEFYVTLGGCAPTNFCWRMDFFNETATPDVVHVYADGLEVTSAAVVPMGTNTLHYEYTLQCDDTNGLPKMEWTTDLAAVLGWGMSVDESSLWVDCSASGTNAPPGVS